MRIIQIIQKKQLRGAEVFATQISEHFKKMGHEVLVIALLDGKDKLPFSDEIFCLNVNLNKRSFDFTAWKRLAAIIKQFNPDVVQANAGDTLKYAVFSKIFFRWRQPLLFRNASMVSNYVKRKISRLWVRFLYSHVDHFLSVSDHTKKDLEKHFNVSEKRVDVVPVGVENKPFKKLPAFDNNKINLVHVGGFTFEKNHEGLLSVFKKVLNDHPNSKLWLVGDGPLKTKIKEKAQALSLNEHIEWVGFVNNPLDYIHSADLLLLPSIIEGLPGVILEAFYCKTPVAAYNVGGISELVNHNITGKLIVAGDENEMVASVNSIITADKQFLDQMVSSAHKKVMESYTNEKLAERLITIYNRIQNQYK